MAPRSARKRNAPPLKKRLGRQSRPQRGDQELAEARLAKAGLDAGDLVTIMWAGKRAANRLGALKHLKRVHDHLAVEIDRLEQSDDAAQLARLVIEAPLYELRRKLDDAIAAYATVRKSPTSKLTAEADRHIVLEAIGRGWSASTLGAVLYLRKMFRSLKDADNWASVNYWRARKRAAITEPTGGSRDT